MVSINQEIKWALERAKKKLIIPWDDLAEEITELFENFREGDFTKADIYFICNDLLTIIKRSHNYYKDAKRKKSYLPYVTQIHPGLIKILHNLPGPIFRELIKRFSKYGKSKSDIINAILKSLNIEKASEWKEALQQERLEQSDIGQRIKEKQSEKANLNIPDSPIKKSQEFDPRQLALFAITKKLTIVKENSVLKFIAGFNGSLQKDKTIGEIVQYGKKLSGTSSLDDVVSGWESFKQDNFNDFFIPNFKIKEKPISHINTICYTNLANGYRAAGAYHLFVFRINRNDYATCDLWLFNNTNDELYS